MTKQEHFDACFGASVLGALGVCRAAASKDTFRATGGAVVLMSSVAGLRGQVGMSAYSTTKAAVDGLVRSAALELAPKAIRVNSIAAGGVRTEMHERITGKLDAASNDAYAARHPLGLGDPDDVVGLGLFLISDLGRWMTGATIVMDGGYCTR
jgi:short-subunit dehydrogenase